MKSLLSDSVARQPWTLVPGMKRWNVTAASSGRLLGSKEANGFINRGYESDIDAALGHFTMPWPSLVATSGVTAAGQRVGRWGLAWRVLALLTLPFRTPTPRAFRRTFDHIRHQWMRRPAYAEEVRGLLAHDAAGRLR